MFLDLFWRYINQPRQYKLADKTLADKPGFDDYIELCLSRVAGSIPKTGVFGNFWRDLLERTYDENNILLIRDCFFRCDRFIVGRWTEITDADFLGPCEFIPLPRKTGQRVPEP